jgi:alpha-maltose-1-phosphate synthase
MRLGYCCHDSFPSSDTNTQQIFWTVFEVARFGFSVDLVVPSVVPGAGSVRARVGRYYGVSPDDMPAGFSIAPAGPRTASQPLAKGWFDWRVARRLSRDRYDLIWTRDALAAVSCARAGLPVVFETYRPDFATGRGFALWRRLLFASPGFRGLIAHSRVAATAFIAAGVPEERCLIAHNGFAPRLMMPRLDRAAARDRLGLPHDTALVVYAGHVGPEKGIDALMRMMAGVPHATLLVLGAGDGSPEAAFVADAARAAGAVKLLLRPRVPVADVAAYLYAADCLAIPPTDDPLVRFGRTVLPMKIFSYLAAGRPIVAPRTPDVAEVLVDGETAILVAPGSDDSGAGALARLLADRGLQNRLAAGAIQASAAYTWEARAEKLGAFFRKLGAAGRSASGR